jgi:hypothetical protein
MATLMPERPVINTASCYIQAMKDKPLSPELDTIELYPDAWERTERAIKAAMGHKPGATEKAPVASPARSVVKRKS